MSPLAIIIIVLYLAASLGIGLYVSRGARDNISTYYVAGRSIGPFVNGIAICAVLMSSGAFMGLPGLGYAGGVAYAACIGFGTMFGVFFAGLVVAYPLRKSGKFTIVDYLSSRYDSKLVAGVASIIVAVSFFMYIVPQLKAASIVLQLVFGTSYTLGVVISAFAFVLYVCMGGMVAVTWTDFMQGGVLIISSILLAVVVLSHGGGLTPLLLSSVEKLPEIAATNKHFLTYLGAFLIYAFCYIAFPPVAMRILSAKSEKAAQKSFNTVLGFTSLFYGLAVPMMIFGALLFAGTLSTPDQASIALASNIMPAGIARDLLLGIVAAGILAAVMSSVDGFLLIVSSTLVNDFWLKLVNPKLPEKKQIKAAIWINTIVGILAMLVAFNPPQFLVLMIATILGLIASAFVAPVALGLWWPKASCAGAVGGIFSGTIVYLFLFLTKSVPAQFEVVPALIISLLFTIGLSIAYPQSSKKMIETINT